MNQPKGVKGGPALWGHRSGTFSLAMHLAAVRAPPRPRTDLHSALSVPLLKRPRRDSKQLSGRLGVPAALHSVPAVPLLEGLLSAGASRSQDTSLLRGRLSVRGKIAGASTQTDKKKVLI